MVKLRARRLTSRRPEAPGGQNYGWDCWEGALRRIPKIRRRVRCNPVSIAPVHEYDHVGGKCSITGGYVYRGPSYVGFAGAYFFADYCSAEMWTLRRTGGSPVVATLALTVTGATLDQPAAFGQDAAGRIVCGFPFESSTALSDPNGPAIAPECRSADRRRVATVTLSWGGNAANCNYEVAPGKLAVLRGRRA